MQVDNNEMKDMLCHAEALRALSASSLSFFFLSISHFWVSLGTVRPGSSFFFHAFVGFHVSPFQKLL
jgi:hypothetical protein